MEQLKDSITEHKICSICGKSFPATLQYFYKNKTSVEGLFPYCKTCSKNKTKKWVERNSEHVATYKKEWYQREENYKIVKKRAGKWRKHNPEHQKTYQLQYQRDNKDKMKEYRKRHKSHDITKEEWEKCLQYFDYSCAYCGMSQEIAEKTYSNCLHKEHVDCNGGNDLSNCVPSCKSCNSRKHTLSLDEWYSSKNPVYSKERSKKINKWLKDNQI